MTNFRGIFPGIFTVGNLFCGFLAILSAFDGQVMNSCRFILLGFFLDGLDGFVARVSNSVSRFGMELDSLADLLTFGVAPAVLLYKIRLESLGNWGWMVAFVFIMCGAFRLARYNLSARTSPRGTFEGLPIPAAASLLVSYTLFCLDVWGEFRLVRFLVVMMIVTSGLMVSSIPYENKPTSWRDRRDRFKFLFILAAIVGAVIDLSKTLFPFVLIYVFSGLVWEAVRLYQSGRRYARNIRSDNA